MLTSSPCRATSRVQTVSALNGTPLATPQFQRPGLPVVVEFAHISGQKWEVNPQKTFRNVKECHFPSDLSTKIGMDMDG